MNMNKIQTFNGKEIIGSIFWAILLFVIGYSIIDYQIIAAIALMIGGLLSIISIFQDDIKTELYDNKLVIHKLFRTNEILLKNISSLKKEKRSYGKYPNLKECLIIEYKELSGYGDELVYVYDEEMHKLIQEQLL